MPKYNSGIIENLHNRAKGHVNIIIYSNEHDQ